MTGSIGKLTIAICAAIMLAGCGAKTQPRYYQLAAAAERPAKPAQTAALIGIGPVTLPEYLARQPIVTRISANQLAISDQHRWAEPLADNIPRILKENLARLLATDRIEIHPWASEKAPDLQLRVQVIQFEGDAENRARLHARWSVIGPDRAVLLPERLSTISVVAGGKSEEAMVAALSETLATLCREAAGEIAKLAGRDK